jgi:hypothetical protein
VATKKTNGEPTRDQDLAALQEEQAELCEVLKALDEHQQAVQTGIKREIELRQSMKARTARLFGPPARAPRGPRKVKDPVPEVPAETPAPEGALSDE